MNGRKRTVVLMFLYVEWLGTVNYSLGRYACDRPEGEGLNSPDNLGITRNSACTMSPLRRRVTVRMLQDTSLSLKLSYCNCHWEQWHFLGRQEAVASASSHAAPAACFLKLIFLHAHSILSETSILHVSSKGKHQLISSLKKTIH